MAKIRKLGIKAGRPIKPYEPFEDPFESSYSGLCGFYVLKVDEFHLAFSPEGPFATFEHPAADYDVDFRIPPKLMVACVHAAESIGSLMLRGDVLGQEISGLAPCLMSSRVEWPSIGDFLFYYDDPEIIE
ncbi:hypothetical protein ACFL2Q_02610 [Thermodesulfobacteriota bacterium]